MSGCKVTEWLSSIKKLQECSSNLAICQTSLQTRTDELTVSEAAKDAALQHVRMLTVGPDPPPDSDFRVITIDLQSGLLLRELEDRYAQCSCTRFSDSHFLVTSKPHVDRYVDYLVEYWLPHVKPYTVINWTRLDSDIVKIAQVDCDNFAGFAKGITAAHGIWAALPWGIFWSVVTGFMIKGPHAFNFITSYKPGYDEVTIDGLELWNLEPQTGSTWEVEVPGIGVAVVGQVEGIKLVPFNEVGFTAGETWLTLV